MAFRLSRWRKLVLQILFFFQLAAIAGSSSSGTGHWSPSSKEEPTEIALLQAEEFAACDGRQASLYKDQAGGIAGDGKHIVLASRAKLASELNSRRHAKTRRGHRMLLQRVIPNRPPISHDIGT